MAISIRSRVEFGKRNLSVWRAMAATKMTCVENPTLENESSACVQMTGDRASRAKFA
jgi:hypothetical protein